MAAALAARRRPGPPQELVEAHNAHGRFALRRRVFARDHLHGTWRLEEVEGVRGADAARLARDPELSPVDWTRALYLDIETTGLSGGAGTIPFLVAMGVFEEEGFVLYQGFLRGPEEEAAMLADVADRVANAQALVSFFGKSFDRHRLEDKMRVHGIRAPFAERPHWDLYHPLRRLYEGAFRDGRLGTMERELCGVQRVDDLSGRFAPEAWFDFLADRAHLLEDVFRHNEDDVLSLVVLAAHLGCALREVRGDETPLDGPADVRAVGLARLFHEGPSGEGCAEVLRWAREARERGAGNLRELGWLEGQALRRMGQHEQAAACFSQLVAEERTAVDGHAFQAWVALAKHHEHRTRSLRDARDCVRAAERLARTRVAVSAGARRDLERRALRLDEKLAAAGDESA